MLTPIVSPKRHLSPDEQKVCSARVVNSRSHDHQRATVYFQLGHDCNHGHRGMQFSVAHCGNGGLIVQVEKDRVPTAHEQAAVLTGHSFFPNCRRRDEAGGTGGVVVGYFSL